MPRVQWSTAQPNSQLNSQFSTKRNPKLNSVPEPNENLIWPNTKRNSQLMVPNMLNYYLKSPAVFQLLSGLSDLRCFYATFDWEHRP